MMTRRNIICIFLLTNTVNLWGLVGFSEGAFPLVFPLLTTNWYYKPSPKEQVFLGLILVKVLALRLASVTGLLSLGKRSISSSTNRKHGRQKLSQADFQIVERVLLSLRRTDTNDCFIREVCQLNQDVMTGNSSVESNFLDLFRLRKTMNAEQSTESTPKEWIVWDSFEEITSTNYINCTDKFPLCTLSKEELEFEALLSDTF